MDRKNYITAQAEWVASNSIRSGAFVKRDGRLVKVEAVKEEAIRIQDGTEVKDVPFTELKAVSFKPLDLRKDDLWIDMVGRKVFSNKDNSCSLITSADPDKVRIDQRWFYPDLLLRAFHDAEGLPLGEIIEAE